MSFIFVAVHTIPLDCGCEHLQSDLFRTQSNWPCIEQPFLPTQQLFFCNTVSSIHLFTPRPRSRLLSAACPAVRPLGRPVVRPCFVSRTISRKPSVGLFSYCIRTSIGVLMYLLGLWPLTFDFEAIIDFNWWRLIRSFSSRYLGKCFLYCFHIAHTHPSGGVDVPFLGGYDIWPNF